MAMIHVPLSDTLRIFVEEQAATHGLAGPEEYVGELVKLQRLRALLIAGVESGPAEAMTETFFEDLRERARRAA